MCKKDSLFLCDYSIDKQKQTSPPGDGFLPVAGSIRG